jgi:hypothetical protein
VQKSIRQFHHISIIHYICIRPQLETNKNFVHAVLWPLIYHQQLKTKIMTIQSCLKRLSIFTLLIVLFASCDKEETVTSEPPPASKMRMLTANVWIYDSVYTNWGTASQAVVFASSATSNVQDWSKSRVKFYIDGTFNEILTTGALRQGPDYWTMNSDSTILNTSGGGYSNSAQILSLSSTKMVWYDAPNKMRGVQIPKY